LVVGKIEEALIENLFGPSFALSSRRTRRSPGSGSAEVVVA